MAPRPFRNRLELQLDATEMEGITLGRRSRLTNDLSLGKAEGGTNAPPRSVCSGRVEKISPVSDGTYLTGQASQLKIVIELSQRCQTTWSAVTISRTVLDRNGHRGVSVVLVAGSGFP